MYTDLKFVSAASDTLVPILGALTDVLPRAGHVGKGLFLQLSESNVPDSPEGYVLEVNDKGVTVTALHGSRTVLRLPNVGAVVGR